MDHYLSNPFEPRSLNEVIQKYRRKVDREVSSNAVDPVTRVAESSPNEQQLLLTSKLQTSLHSTPPLDAEVLLHRCLGDVEFMDSLLTELMATGQTRVDEIAACAKSANCLDTANAAHALKGTAAILGASSILRLTAGIEEKGRDGTLDGVLEMIEQLRIEMDRCVQFIPSVQLSNSNR